MAVSQLRPSAAWHLHLQPCSHPGSSMPRAKPSRHTARYFPNKLPTRPTDRRPAGKPPDSKLDYRPAQMQKALLVEATSTIGPVRRASSRPEPWNPHVLRRSIGQRSRPARLRNWSSNPASNLKSQKREARKNNYSTDSETPKGSATAGLGQSLYAFVSVASRIKPLARRSQGSACRWRLRSTRTSQGSPSNR